MPNYCSNTITLVGPKESLDLIKELSTANKEDRESWDWNYQAIVPMPEAEDNDEEDNEKWFKDVFYYWGQEWSGGELDYDDNGTIQNEDNRVYYRFGADSAWSPPLQYLNFLSKRFPEILVDIVYDEPGMDFSGHYIVQNGKVLLDDQRESMMPDEDEDAPEEGAEGWVEPEDKHQDYWFEPKQLNDMLNASVLEDAIGNC